MKTIFPTFALWLCFVTAFGQVAPPDTIYFYEMVTVYDTIVIHDTIRVKKALETPIIQPKNMNTDFSSPSTATFSQNDIILHDSYKQKNVRTMKLNMANFLSAAILSAQTLTGLSAQETQPEEALKNFPIQVGIVYPITTQGRQTVNYCYNLSFNLFLGKVGAVKGVEYGGLFNRVEQDVMGVQFGGLGNAAKTVKGIQFGGLANVAKDNTGIQYAGLFNITDSIKGIQFAGITNICRETTGIQFAGITNLSEQAKGLQFSGIVNVTDKSEGLQFAGITNVSKKVSGASFGGVFNRTGTLRGVQFGLVNVIDSVETGVSVALINIVKKCFYNEFSLTFADYQNVGLSYKMGTKKFYTIFTAGANFMEKKLWVFGLGFGNRTPLGRRIDFQPEIVSYHYFPNDFKNVRDASANHLKLGFVYKLNERLGIVVAPSIYYFNDCLKDNEQAYKISPIKAFYSRKYDDYLHTIGMGISVGLILR